MNNRVLAILVSLLLFPLSSLGASDSTELFSPTTKQAMIICPEVRVGSTKLTQTPQNVSLGSIDCIDVSGGGLGWALSIFIGIFDPTCPSTHPYMGGLTEAWGGAFFILGIPAGGGAGMTVSCCTTPQPQMSLRVGYQSSTPSTSTWQEGPACP